MHILWLTIIFPQVNGGEEDYNEDEHDFEESGEEEEEEDEDGGVGPLANGGEGEGVMEGRVGWEVTNTCDFCKNIFTLNSYLNVHI